MSADNAYAVELKGLTFKRGTRSIFNNVDIRIPRGKVTGIMGPSGCGKTTLLRLMGMQLRPSAGEVWVNGQNLPTLSRSDLFDARKHMGVLFQSGALFTDLDVFENVAFPLRVHTQLSDEMIRDIVLLKLQAVGLRGAIDLMPDELSGGMKRRVALARAIALDPQILMYDEPFVGQDPIAMGVLVRLIRLLNDALGITSIVVSHDLAELKSKLNDALPDLFIIDVMLPDGNGIEICDDLKTDMFTKHIPVIVMSANPGSKEKSVTACADDYISKPFDLDYVVKRIERLLSKQEKV